MPKEYIALLAGLVGTLLGALITSTSNYFVNRQQMAVKMVEIGISVLRAEPKQENAVMRDWAIDTIEINSGRSFTAAQREALKKQELPFNAEELIAQKMRNIEGIRKLQENFRSEQSRSLAVPPQTP